MRCWLENSLLTDQGACPSTVESARTINAMARRMYLHPSTSPEDKATDVKTFKALIQAHGRLPEVSAGGGCHTITSSLLKTALDKSVEELDSVHPE